MCASRWRGLRADGLCCPPSGSGRARIRKFRGGAGCVPYGDESRSSSAPSFGFAGVVLDGRVELLNRGWTVDLAALEPQLGVGRRRGRERLRRHGAFRARTLWRPGARVAGGQAPDPHGSLVVGGPGTGFGLGVLQMVPAGLDRDGRGGGASGLHSADGNRMESSQSGCGRNTAMSRTRWSRPGRGSTRRATRCSR